MINRINRNRVYLAVRIVAVAVFVFAALLIAISVITSPKASAMPDPYMPLPPVWCPGGGGQSPWGGYCDGKTFPDGTKLHIANGMGFWLPVQCVIAGTPAPPPLAGPGGCGGFV